MWRVWRIICIVLCRSCSCMSASTHRAQRQLPGCCQARKPTQLATIDLSMLTTPTHVSVYCLADWQRVKMVPVMPFAAFCRSSSSQRHSLIRWSASSAAWGSKMSLGRHHAPSALKQQWYRTQTGTDGAGLWSALPALCSSMLCTPLAVVTPRLHHRMMQATWQCRDH